MKSVERKWKLKHIIQRAIMAIGREEDGYENLSSIDSVSSFENYSDIVSELTSSRGSSTTFYKQNQHYKLTTLSMFQLHYHSKLRSLIQN